MVSEYCGWVRGTAKEGTGRGSERDILLGFEYCRYREQGKELRLWVMSWY